ncbi:ATP-binding protein [Youngiibacter fragilis]|uniref:ATPase AAA n=1 Tax=Youngiibacter fragilis 232.1 TaxID=994573 RepID=V7I388_9CLOT|nr:ATP-binding protein [Youngiibacter fragilis]ETA80710.1 ATPase AAA [Youngiibacter fragilis 232.1]
MKINRDGYLDKIRLREKNGMIKVITGVRRVGKSYLLFNIFLNDLLERGIARDHIIDIPLDDIEYEELRESHALYRFVKSKIIDDKQYYVLLDEIQYVPRFVDVMNSFLHIENLDVYVTGSNSKFVSSDILTEFRGRGDEIRVYPLSFAEFMTVYDGSEVDGLNEYMTYGGLPRIVSMKTDDQKSKYLENLFKETYIKDIIDRNKIKNTGEFEDLVNILASAIGSLTNPKKLENTFQSVMKSTITDKTIKTYIDYLKDAFLIDLAIRYDIKGRKYVSTPMKIYFVDTGLRNARLGFRQIEESHLMENMIYNELKVRGFSVDVGLIETREVDENGAKRRKSLEVDFIAHKGNNKYYIQSAFALPDTEKKAQEERPLLNINDSFKKIVIIGNQIKLKRDENGIATLGIREFLLKENSLDL